MMLADLQGQIERITYSNEENGYAIDKLKVYGRRHLVTVAGNLMSPMPGVGLRMTRRGSGIPIYGVDWKKCKEERYDSSKIRKSYERKTHRQSR